jgi:heat shock protein HslJ
MKIASISSLILALTLSACLSDHTAQLLQGGWRVVSIQATGQAVENAPAEYILRFGEDGNLSLRLDVNSCGGRFNTFNGGNIDIEPMGCTEACCDTPFAQQLAGLLSEMEHFDIQGRTLTLHGAAGLVVARAE